MLFYSSISGNKEKWLYYNWCNIYNNRGNCPVHYRKSLWRIIKIKNFPFKNISQFIVPLIKLMPLEQLKYIRLRVLAVKAPECYALYFFFECYLFSPLCQVLSWEENFFLFPWCFILFYHLFQPLAPLKYTISWKTDNEGYSVASKIIKMAECFFSLLL